MHTIPETPFVHTLLAGLLKFLFVFGGAFFLLWYYLKNSRIEVPAVPVSQDKSMVLPLRLQAYERFVLFLERIHPTSLAMRLSNPDLTSTQLQSLVVRTIREEMDYNLSQQLYISIPLWELIKNAKEETIALVNQAASGLPDGSMSGDLVKNIFAVAIAKGKLPVEEALDEIKRELQRIIS